MNNINFLHIPKTGGTALKTLIKDGYRFFDVCRSHQKTIESCSNVIFVVRDPWERFCSGFWEAKTIELRRDLSKESSNKKYAIGNYNKLNTFPAWYHTLLSSVETPDKFCTLLKNDPKIRDLLYSFNSTSTYFTHTTLGMTTQSLTWWLGSLETFISYENKIEYAIDISALNKFMRNYYRIEMPTNTFRARSREQFDLEQTYDVSEKNLDWFKTQFRKTDYELIEHIKVQPYYYD